MNSETLAEVPAITAPRRCSGDAARTAASIAGPGKKGRRAWRIAFASRYAGCRKLKRATVTALRASLGAGTTDIALLPFIPERSGREDAFRDERYDNIAEGTSAPPRDRTFDDSDAANVMSFMERVASRVDRAEFERMAKDVDAITMRDTTALARDIAGGTSYATRTASRAELHSLVDMAEATSMVDADLADKAHAAIDRFSPSTLADRLDNGTADMLDDMNRLNGESLPDGRTLGDITLGEVRRDLEAEATAAADAYPEISW